MHMMAAVAATVGAVEEVTTEAVAANISRNEGAPLPGNTINNSSSISKLRTKGVVEQVAVTST